MKRATLPHVVAWSVGLAILALLIYSLDRTAWLFQLYESGQPHAAAIGLLAAVVVELAAIALIAGDGLAESLSDDLPTQQALRRWAGRGLILVLLVQALANLIAGYLRGGTILLTQLGAGWAAYVVSAVAWLSVNAAVPALLFMLAKLESHTIRLLLTQASRQTPDQASRVAQLDEEVAQTTRQLAEQTERAETLHMQLARAVDDRHVAQQEQAALHAQLSRMVEQLGQAEAQLVASERIDPVALALELRQPRSDGTPWRSIESLLHMPESTLRRKVGKPRQE